MKIIEKKYKKNKYNANIYPATKETCIIYSLGHLKNTLTVERIYNIFYREKTYVLLNYLEYILRIGMEI